MDTSMLKLNIRTMNSTLTVEVEKTGKVLDLKKKIKEQTQASEDEQKVIYKGTRETSIVIGKILKDEDLLETHKIQSGDSLHLVVKKKTAAAPAPKPEEKEAIPPPPPSASASMGTGMPGMGMPGMMPGMGMPPMGMGMGGMPNMASMMESPFFQQQMNTVINKGLITFP